MATVVVRNGNVDGALRTLKQKNAKDGSSKKLRERQEGYMKPGVKKRLAQKEAIKNSKKNSRNTY
ncbi:MAG: 30S ribosomal protein S21 [Bacilli bacterium]|nr:30S ribosomal protein S21 [Bacilli bacterium]